MIAESLLGSLIGGALRIAPEFLKFFDRKGERQHELSLLRAEMEFAQIKGEIAMRQTEAVMTVAEMDAIGQALKEQGATAKAAGKWVAGISALVRPLVTYWFVALYSAHKIASMQMAYEQAGNWRDVFVTSWSDADMAILSMILTFWFVGRVWERANKR
jgi:hypothetical protein